MSNPPVFSSSQHLPATPCYLNGEFTPLNQAKVSVMDRGFIFGDGIYEVVPVYAGKLFRFAEHMTRLERSLGELRMGNPLTRDQWRALGRQLVSRLAQFLGQSEAQTDQLIYIQVTRGVALRDHVMPADIAPTVFAVSNLMKPVPPEQRARGCGLRHGGRLSLAQGAYQKHQSAGRGVLTPNQF